MKLSYKVNNNVFIVGCRNKDTQIDIVIATIARVLYGVKYCRQKVRQKIGQKISVIKTNSFDDIKKIFHFGILIRVLS